MKIKYNMQKINSIKEGIENVLKKIRNKRKTNTKIAKKNYALLLLMVLLSVVTLSKNVKEYISSNAEEYIKYEYIEQDKLSIEEQNNSGIITDASSIYTIEPNLEKSIQTISTEVLETYIMPLEGDIIKDYAKDTLVYSKTLDMWKVHPGIDIKGDANMKVISVTDGDVVNVEENPFYGKTIKISNSKGYTFVYGNLDNDIKVEKGDRVSIGDYIGSIGMTATGELADETHLHFEILKNGEHINPVYLLELK